MTDDGRQPQATALHGQSTLVDSALHDNIREHFNRSIRRTYFFHTVLLWICFLFVVACIDDAGFHGVTHILGSIVGKPHPDALADHFMIPFVLFATWTWTLFIKRWQLRHRWLNSTNAETSTHEWETGIDLAFLTSSASWLPVGICMRFFVLFWMILTPAVVYVDVYDKIVLEKRLTFHKDLEDDGKGKYDCTDEKPCWTPHSRMPRHRSRDIGLVVAYLVVAVTAFSAEIVSVRRSLRILAAQWPRHAMLVLTALTAAVEVVIVAFLISKSSGTSNVNWHVHEGDPLLITPFLHILALSVPLLAVYVFPAIVWSSLKPRTDVQIKAIVVSLSFLLILTGIACTLCLTWLHASFTAVLSAILAVLAALSHFGVLRPDYGRE